MTPTTEPAKRIATLFHRRLSTEWLPKEIKAYKLLVKLKYFDTLDDLRLVETYYVFNEKKEGVYLRTNLYAFLNNYSGEVDKARAWSQHHKAKVKKANPNHVFGTATDEDFKRIGELARAEVQRLKLSLSPRFQSTTMDSVST